jgi:hypothetical protein
MSKPCLRDSRSQAGEESPSAFTALKCTRGFLNFIKLITYGKNFRNDAEGDGC